MKKLNLGFLGIISVLFSLLVVGYYGIESYVNNKTATDIKTDFDKIAISVKSFFYNENYKMLDPKRLTLDVLLNTFYLRGIEKNSYKFLWIDSDYSDGKLKVAIVCLKKVKPTILSKKLKNLVWYDPASEKLHINYNPAYYPAVLVEVEVFER